MALDPNVERCPTGTFARAEQLIVQKRYREAIAFCRQQLAESPRCVTLRLLLAKAFLADGSGAAGVAQLEECLRIDPTTAAARRLLVELGVDVPMPIAEVALKRRPPSIEPLPPPPSPAPPPRRATPAPIAPSPRVVYSAPSLAATSLPASRTSSPMSSPRTSSPMAAPRATSMQSPRTSSPMSARSAAAPSLAVAEPMPAIAPVHPAPRIVHSSPTASSPLLSTPLLSTPLAPVAPRIAHDAPAKARKRQATQRRRAVANPFVVAEAKPSRASARWERPLSIEKRRPQPLFRLGIVALAIAGLMALWRLGREEAATLPTAALAASRPTPEPPVKKADTAPIDGVAGDIWIHPLAGPERRMPVRDSRLFGAERVGDRPSECRGGHCGIDLAGAYGEPVFAVHDGVVERVQRALNPDHGGRYVRLAHRDGAIATQYFHLSDIPRRIVEGVKVKAGEVVGYVGLTGVKHSEPHLHFTIEVQDPESHEGRYLDPEPLVALWPLRVSHKGDEELRLTAAPPGLARGFLRRRHRHHSAPAAD